MTPDYARGFNAGLDKAMQILHIRCCTTFDAEMKREKMAEPSCKHPVFTHDYSAHICADCGTPFRLSEEPWQPYTREEACSTPK